MPRRTHKARARQKLLNAERRRRIGEAPRRPRPTVAQRFANEAQTEEEK